MLKLVEINPNHRDWEQYLSLSAFYFKENWPDLFPESLEKIARDYSYQLQERLKKGGRGLFFVKAGEEYIGNANVYLTQENGVTWLNIGEFYIIPNKRRSSLGTLFFELLCKWGEQYQAIGVKLEVSKNKVDANRFWSSLGFELAGSVADKCFYVKRF